MMACYFIAYKAFIFKDTFKSYTWIYGNDEKEEDTREDGQTLKREREVAGESEGTFYIRHQSLSAFHSSRQHYSSLSLVPTHLIGHISLLNICSLPCSASIHSHGLCSTPKW
ncbi:unnamed protein product [Boreogadus saida]